MSDPVRIHMRIPGTAPVPALMDLIENIERAGFDGVGVLDSQLIARDTFITLAQAATRTTRLQLFPAVTNPFTRHPSVLASAIQTVEELAPGRVKFVIGTGFTSASTIGRKPATLAEMRACIGNVKALLAGEAVDWNGTAGRLAFASGKRRPVPVLMAGSGPKAIATAGEVADGAVLMVGFNRTLVQRALEQLDTGARRAGRRLDDIEIIWAVRTGTAATMDEARRQARPTAVQWAIRWDGQWLERAGIRAPRLKVPDAVWKIYPDLSHAEDWEAAIEATSFVSDDLVAELCDALGLVGTPEYCADRIAELTKLGVRNVYLMPFQTFATPESEIPAFRDVIFPRLRAAGLR
jgi:5,10-methylenetetrahydromethanopterin reductase